MSLDHLHRPSAAAIGLLALLAAPVAGQEAIPDRPEEIDFPSLSFPAPDADEYRHELSNGVVVYVAPDHELPLVDLTFAFKGGSYLDAEGEEGLTSAMAAMMRRGGAGELKARELDERLDFLAAEAGSGAGEYRVTASLDTLKRNLQESLGLFVDMLRAPRFQADRLELYRDEVREAMKQRNDSADDILSREWTALVYGRDHFKGRLATEASLEAITRERLQDVHARLVHPGNLVVGVSGDVEVEGVLAELEAAFEGWEAGEAPADPPAPTHEVPAGVHYVEKDIPQGKVRLGMRSIQRDDPDAFALQVMSRILGSGGFTSRIARRVRSDEGLAYSAGAAVIPGLYFPGEFRGFVQSKSRTVALSIQIILEEIARIRSEAVGDKELRVAKQALIESFPEKFGSPAETVSTLVADEVTGRPDDYWQTWRDRVRAVTKKDVQRVAQEHLDPDAMTVLVVGRWADIREGDLEGRASIADLPFEGSPTELPLRDPLTLEPLD